MKQIEVKRDEYGYWTHPEYFEPANGNEYGFPGEFDAWLYKHNLQCHIMSIECDDQAGEVAERHFEGQLDGDISEWQPTKPDGNGWFIGSIHDTEDGPYCIWFRNKQAA